MKKIFVSFYFCGRFGSGFGREIIERKTITSIEDVKDIEKNIVSKDEDIGTVTIISWQELDSGA